MIKDLVDGRLKAPAAWRYGLAVAFGFATAMPGWRPATPLAIE